MPKAKYIGSEYTLISPDGILPKEKIKKGETIEVSAKVAKQLGGLTCFEVEKTKEEIKKEKEREEQIKIAQKKQADHIKKVEAKKELCRKVIAAATQNGITKVKENFDLNHLFKKDEKELEKLLKKLGGEVVGDEEPEQPEPEPEPEQEEEPEPTSDDEMEVRPGGNNK